MADSMTIEQRIAHFLRLAQDDGATQDERDLASTQAERLMLKHGIERAMLPDADAHKHEQVVLRKLFFGGAYATARMRSFFAVVYALKLSGYHTPNVWGEDPISHKNVRGEQVTLVGFEKDADDALHLLRSLDVQAAVAVKAWVATRKGDWEWEWKSPAEKTLARSSFLESFGQGVAKRIREERAVVIRESADSVGTELVLVDRQRQVKDWLRANVSLRSGRSSSRRVDSSGRAAGTSAGYNAGGTGRGVTSGTRALTR